MRAAFCIHDKCVATRFLYKIALRQFLGQVYIELGIRGGRRGAGYVGGGRILIGYGYGIFAVARNVDSAVLSLYGNGFAGGILNRSAYVKVADRAVTRNNPGGICAYINVTVAAAAVSGIGFVVLYGTRERA